MKIIKDPASVALALALIKGSSALSNCIWPNSYITCDGGVNITPTQLNDPVHNSPPDATQADCAKGGYNVAQGVCKLFAVGNVNLFGYWNQGGGTGATVTICYGEYKDSAGAVHTCTECSTHA